MGSITALIINWSPVGVFYQAFAGVMSWFGIKLPAQFTKFGANILRSLIEARFWLRRDAISNAGSSTIAWFKEKLGIHSPGRVFAQLGDYTMQGLAVGLDRSGRADCQGIGPGAARLTQLGASIAIGTATALLPAPSTCAHRCPQGGFGAGMTIQGDKIRNHLPRAGRHRSASHRAQECSARPARPRKSGASARPCATTIKEEKPP